PPRQSTGLTIVPVGSFSSREREPIASPPVARSGERLTHLGQASRRHRGRQCHGDLDCVEMEGRIALPAREGGTLSLFHPTVRRLAMPATYNILIMGASYGSLLASKLLFGGHQVKLVCLPAEADLINAEGFRVRLPIKGRKDPIEIDSRKLPGKV